MKRTNSIVLAFSLSAIVLCAAPEVALGQSGYPHHPQCGGGGHGGSSSCWSYATSRAFGRGWGHSGCPAATFNSVNAISLDHFERFDLESYSDLQVGDIIGWGEFTQPNHVSFITAIFSPSASNIRVAQVENEGATTEQPNLWLSDVINGTGGAIARGNPTMFFRKRPRWSIILQNSFNGAKVGVGGGQGAEEEGEGSPPDEYDSPHTVSNLHWESSVIGVAVMDGVEHEGYVRRFRR